LGVHDSSVTIPEIFTNEEVCRKFVYKNSQKELGNDERIFARLSVFVEQGPSERMGYHASTE
jgi:hypothetical protein